MITLALIIGLIVLVESPRARSGLLKGTRATVRKIKK